MKVLVLVDGEHYPPVVRATIEQLPARLAGAEVVGAALLGGGEKLPINLSGDLADDLGLGIPVVRGDGCEAALAEGLRRFRPELVVDLSDEPVLDSRQRMGLAARSLAAGVAYLGADFRFDPPPRPRVATKPSVAVIGTGKRTGKTALSASLARLLAGRGTPPVVVAMGRGGPPEPELVDPATFDLTPAGLAALAASGRHAASDHLEDALMAGVVTVGTRRCGGGLAGAPFDSTFVAGVELADGRSETLLVLEGSGSSIPPVHADATICAVPATADPELVTGYLGAYRLLLSDLIVVTMGEPSSAELGAGAPKGPDFLEECVRRLVPGVPVVQTVLRPFPLEPVSGQRVFYVTTAPASANEVLVDHLEQQHGCSVVGSSHHLANRPALASDLETAPDAEVMLVELKAAAMDLAARIALERGMRITFCDNRVVSTGGDGTFDDLALRTADLAVDRFSSSRPVGEDGGRR
ncbi:MAG: cyclic 2,3-diphosphoglycerate synthase [Actinomycetota bacterium]|nr:cyclic 2,3-diphosphoglycerate synthase [Actinomycetota bacterium]